MRKSRKQGPDDLNETAFRIAEQATGEAEPEPEPTEAQIRAQKAGREGGAKRAANLTPEERSAIAKKAAESRWSSRDGGGGS